LHIAIATGKLNYIKSNNGEGDDTNDEKEEMKKFARKILEVAKENNGIDCLMN
jgi:hypothetical protein